MLQWTLWCWTWLRSNVHPCWGHGIQCFSETLNDVSVETTKLRLYWDKEPQKFLYKQCYGFYDMRHCLVWIIVYSGRYRSIVTKKLLKLVSILSTSDILALLASYNISSHHQSVFPLIFGLKTAKMTNLYDFAHQKCYIFWDLFLFRYFTVFNKVICTLRTYNWT